MAVVSYQLEHFYYGQLVRQNAPEGDPRLLAYSAGIRQELAEELVEKAPLPPLASVQEGSWAVVRSQQVPFLIIQSQQGAAGQVMMHYVIVKSDVLRALSGNLDALKVLVETELPIYDRLGDRLKPLSLPQAGPPAAADQIDHILDLMTYTQNQTDVLEALLAAVVQGVQIVVNEAPLDLGMRINFVKGLLALLPPPARFGVTFTTHSDADSALDAQIRFQDDNPAPTETLIYHWPTAEISGQKLEDGYSRFIVSQLRLDAQLVIQETQALTQVAAWRIKQGDSLAEALAYASHRHAVDRALRNNQPVEIDDVSQILAEDRSLDADLKATYAQHLLTLSLALDDMQYADPISVVLPHDSDLARITQQKLEAALVEGQAELVFTTLTRWLANPLGPHSQAWVDLAHRAVLVHMDQLGAAGDLEAIIDFLGTVEQVEPGVGINRVVPRLIELALPQSLRHQPLAELLFRLALNYLDHETVLRLLESPRFVERLPTNVQRIVPYLTNAETSRAPAGLLLQVSRVFGEQWEPLVLLRMAEAAVKADRLDLIDTAVLQNLVHVPTMQWGTQHADLLKWLVLNLANDELLPVLDEPGPMYLLQILLLQRHYAELAQEMLHQARLLYPGDLQVRYAAMVQRLFADTDLDAPTALTAVQAIEQQGIKSVPLLMAYIGVLQRHAEVEGVASLAEQVLNALMTNPVIVSVMQPRPMRELLRYFVRQQDMSNTFKVATLFPDVASQHGNRGITLMTEMYRVMNVNDEMQVAALEIMRRYVRQADATSARRALVQFGRELGLQVREALEATYSLKRLMAGVDFLDYADFIHTAAELLASTAMAYSNKNQIPSMGALVNTMQSLSGGIMDDESQAIADSIVGMGRALVTLNEAYRPGVSRNPDKHIDGLIRGETDPQSGLDVLWVIGGYFANGKRYRMTFRHAQHPLGERSAPMLKDETEISYQLLRGVLQAFPPDKKVTISADAVRGEVESLWGVVDETMRKSLVRRLAIDFQRLVQLIDFIAQNGDARVMQSSGAGRRLDTGRHQPKSTLEFFRYIHGYFKVN